MDWEPDAVSSPMGHAQLVGLDPFFHSHLQLAHAATTTVFSRLLWLQRAHERMVWSVYRVPLIPDLHLALTGVRG